MRSGCAGCISRSPLPSCSLRAPPPQGPVDLRSVRVTDDAAFARVGGAEVKLTLDPDLQRAATRILSNAGAHEGAIVASDVRTGRILAWVTRGDRDYVVAPFAPSASLFKIVTTAALLEGGRVNPGTRECYEGGEHAIVPADLERARLGVHDARRGARAPASTSCSRGSRRSTSRRPEIRRKAADLGFSGEVPIDVPSRRASSPSPRIPSAWRAPPRASGTGSSRRSARSSRCRRSPTTASASASRSSITAAPPRAPRRGAPSARGVAASMTRMLEVTTRRGTAAKAFRRPDGTPALAVDPRRRQDWHAHRRQAHADVLVVRRVRALRPSPRSRSRVMLGNDLRWHTKANIVGRQVLEAYFGVTPQRRRRRP